VVYWLSLVALVLNGLLAAVYMSLGWYYLGAAPAVLAGLMLVFLVNQYLEDRPPAWVREALTRPFEVDQPLVDRINAHFTGNGRPATFTVEDFRQRPAGGR
jgi:hypothetical protein